MARARARVSVSRVRARISECVWVTSAMVRGRVSVRLGLGLVLRAVVRGRSFHFYIHTRIYLHFDNTVISSQI